MRHLGWGSVGGRRLNEADEVVRIGLVASGATINQAHIRIVAGWLATRRGMLDAARRHLAGVYGLMPDFEEHGRGRWTP